MTDPFDTAYAAYSCYRVKCLHNRLRCFGMHSDSCEMTGAEGNAPRLIDAWPRDRLLDLSGVFASENSAAGTTCPGSNT